MRIHIANRVSQKKSTINYNNNNNNNNDNNDYKIRIRVFLCACFISNHWMLYGLHSGRQVLEWSKSLLQVFLTVIHLLDHFWTALDTFGEKKTGSRSCQPPPWSCPPYCPCRPQCTSLPQCSPSASERY